MEFLIKEVDFKMESAKANIIKKKLNLNKKNYSKSTRTFEINFKYLGSNPREFKTQLFNISKRPEYSWVGLQNYS